MASVLITGGGRGIGLELTRQLSQLPDSQVSKIVVTTRGDQSSDELNSLLSSLPERVLNVVCEVTSDASVQKAVAKVDQILGDNGLDILINNVGVMPLTPGGMRAMKSESLSAVFDVNVVAAQRITSAFIPAVERSRQKKVVMISTSVGSIAYSSRFAQNPTPEYKITKAAMNMLASQYALEYGPQGFTVLAASPGWLKTDMGSQHADLDVATGVGALKDLILAADSTYNGKFYNIYVPGWENAEGPNQYDGAEIPW